jgi:hypothetical protein
VVPFVIASDLTDYLQINKMRIRFSEDERDHYITKGEICRIRKDVQRANIQLDPNDAQSTRIWVNMLQSEGEFVYYKDKQDPPPEGADLASDLFILCLQSKFQKDAYNRLGNAFLGIDATHNVTQYKGILLFTLMVRDHWGHGM